MITFYLVLILGAASAAPLPETSLDSHHKRKLLENPHLYHGDIVLSNNGNGKNAIVGRTNLWPDGVIPYMMHKRLVKSTNQIRKAMDHIESKTCIRFKPREKESDYIGLFDGDGCYSHVGRNGGKQFISLEDGCRDKGTIVHELMHAIGFYHQQERSDRNKFLKIVWKNIDPQEKDQFQLLRPRENQLLTPFDYNSIMLYGSTAFSKDDVSVTMVPKTQGIVLLEVFDKPGLSPLDVKAINMLYQCK